MESVVAIIPARGGSKGIPRKNLRPLAGKPMIYYSIQACLQSKLVSRVVVSTDDDEIALFAERFGAEVHKRAAELASDTITLDPVIRSATQDFESVVSESYEIVVTVQPTSPLVKPSDIDLVISTLVQDQSDTALTVVDDRHLRWTIAAGEAKPLYDARVNRQQLQPTYRETGAVIACTRSQLDTGSRIGDRISLVEMPQSRSFDIDDISDFYLCESILRKKRIVFAVIGYPEVGLGHVYRALMLAHEFVKHEIIFVCESKSQLAKQQIEQMNYQVICCRDGTMATTVGNLLPDLVINDILDTDQAYIQELKKCGAKVVNFEDLGPGSSVADLVINALYEDKSGASKIKTGMDYFCLRDEFLHQPVRAADDAAVKNILITFGGVDEGNLTKRVAKLLAPWCIKNGAKLVTILGPGYKHLASFEEEFSELGSELVEVVVSTNRISDYMANADLAITSGGRTVFELAATQTPMIVICQNERELTHTFASERNGILNLGDRTHVDDTAIMDAFLSVVNERALYQSMRERLRKVDLKAGKRRVCSLIESILHEED